MCIYKFVRMDKSEGLVMAECFMDAVIHVNDMVATQDAEMESLVLVGCATQAGRSSFNLSAVSDTGK